MTRNNLRSWQRYDIFKKLITRYFHVEITILSESEFLLTNLYSESRDMCYAKIESRADKTPY